MFYAGLEPIFTLLDQGGPILSCILVMLVVLWFMFITKCLDLLFEFPKKKAQIDRLWRARSDHHSWFSRRIKQMYLSELNQALDANMHLMKTIIAMFPLFGLLGTVYGMIEVFEVMASLGNGSPRAMAGGISMATIPTMAGMVSAILGLLFYNLLTRYIESLKQNVQEHLWAHKH